MRYVAFDQPGDPEVLHVAHGADPVARPGEVLISVQAAGVTFADTLQRRGKYPPPQGASPILGLEAAGTIVALGDGVTGFTAGDAVCALCEGGGYAELVAVPAGQVLPAPQGWTAIEAATLPENIFTVYDNLITRARLRSGETALVHGGTSGIGSTAIMLARAIGAPVIATAGTPAKCEASLGIGAVAAINYKTHDFVTEVLELTQGRGVDVVLDIVGGEYVERDLRCLAPDGRIACLATRGGRTAQIDVGQLLMRRATVLGSTLRARTAAQKAAIAQELRDRVWPLLAARDPIAPLVDTVYPFERAAGAHARMEAGEHIGKIVLTP